MAFGFPPKYTEELYLETYTPQQFIVFALEAAKKLNLEIISSGNIGFVATTKNGMFKWNAEFTFKIEGQTATIICKSISNELVDWGRNRKLVNRFRDYFVDFKHTMTEEVLAEKDEEYSNKFVPEEEDLLKKPPLSIAEKIINSLSLFIPRKGFFITPILIDLNILLFIIMTLTGVNFMQPDNESLLLWGANFRPSTLQGEWYRLLTSCFLHIGIFHLLMNMYALLFIGLLLEPYLGKIKFAVAYLLTGLISSTASIYWHDLVISAGASGAIFGMYGVFLAMLTTNIIEKEKRNTLMTSIALFVGYNLINGMKEGIDNSAHIGGLISGFIIGFAFVQSLKKPEDSKLNIKIIALLIICSISISALVYKVLPNDIAKYETEIQTFIKNEELALKVFKMSPDTPKEILLKELKNNGLHYWNENLKLIKELDNLDLPVPIHKKDVILIRYCELRIKIYTLIAKSIEEDTDKYEGQISDFNRQVQDIITVLNPSETQNKTD